MRKGSSIDNIIFTLNKMDLVEWSQEIFNFIKKTTKVSEKFWVF